ncbi:MAG: AraC family transcriptional regulator [Balneola sp.]
MYDIKNAIPLLEKNISSIRTVCEWAETMGYSDPKYFARVFRGEFGTGTKEALVQVRIKSWIEYVRENPKLKNYCTAQEIGLKDEVALNKYLKQYTGKTPTQLKKEIVEGKLSVNEW